jgi:hypothetical protein
MTPVPTFRFHRFELRPASRELLADGVPQRLTPQTRHTLVDGRFPASDVVLAGEPTIHAWPGAVEAASFG